MSFWYLQFSQKMNEKNQLYGTSSRIVFVRFLKELKTPKRHFEINWPLSSTLNNDDLNEEMPLILIKNIVTLTIFKWTSDCSINFLILRDFLKIKIDFEWISPHCESESLHTYLKFCQNLNTLVVVSRYLSMYSHKRFGFVSWHAKKLHILTV